MTKETVFNKFLLGFILLWRGNFDEAEQELSNTVELAERIGDVTTLSRCLTYLTVLYRKQGNEAKVQEYANRSMEIATQANMQEYVGMANANQAWLLRREGKLSEATSILHQVKKIMDSTPQGTMFCWIYAWPLTSILIGQNKFAEAIDLVRIMMLPHDNPQPEAIANLFEAAIEAWERGDTETVKDALNQAAIPAQELGYI